MRIYIKHLTSSSETLIGTRYSFYDALHHKVIVAEKRQRIEAGNALITKPEYVVATFILPNESIPMETPLVRKCSCHCYVFG